MASDKRSGITRAPLLACDFVSFDGGVRHRGELQQPDRYRFWRDDEDRSPRVSRGAGLSYAAGSFLPAGLSVSHASFDRVTGFDAQRSIVEVEAGITLISLHRFLSRRDLYLQVQPGHGRITVGGCIAADVHGKNQARDGTFIDQVQSLTLFHPGHGLLELSREQDPALFRLTCGGYGLTGHIVRARLLARSIPSHRVHLQAGEFAGSEAGLEHLVRAATQSDFAYSWHDMASGGKILGSGYVFQARFAAGGPADATDAGDADAPALSAASRGAWRVALLNSFSVRGLNRIYRFQQRSALLGKNMTLLDALYPVHGAQNYFRLFGSRGFHEYQVILPMRAMLEYVDAIEERVRRRALVITLASAKAFAGTRELLRFTGDGICLALNLPRDGSSLEAMAFLDERVVALGGVPNIIKDSRLPRAVVDACYPGASDFRTALRAYDPKRLFRSEISERLGL